jgi:hypothetical protein
MIIFITVVARFAGLGSRRQQQQQEEARPPR